MDTIVLKFGGSSLSDNLKLNIVAKKVIELKGKGNRIICVVSAQGKTTDKLIKEAKELSAVPNEREMDALLSTGEQVSASKLAILLTMLGHTAISLTGWQAGIYTNSDYQSSKIFNIDVTRINKELDQGKIVIVTGFQGVDKMQNITTLGRGGSDTTAVAIAAAVKAAHCYIFSDVDGVYTADPRDVKLAHKLNSISYEEMSYISGEGAKVLHDRCVELAEKYNMPIIAACTFNKNKGTEIANSFNETNEMNADDSNGKHSNNKGRMEETVLKSIIKNDNILIVRIRDNKNPFNLLKRLIKNKIKIGKYNYENNELGFTINKENRAKLEKLLDKESCYTSIKPVTKISLIGSGISNHLEILEIVLKTLEEIRYSIIDIDVSACKISILFDTIIDIKYLKNMHNNLLGKIM